jgi:hypothetical protein
MNENKKKIIQTTQPSKFILFDKMQCIGFFMRFKLEKNLLK